MGSLVDELARLTSHAVVALIFAMCLVGTVFNCVSVWVYSRPKMRKLR